MSARARRPLPSSSSSSTVLAILRTCRATIGGSSFSAAATAVWNSDTVSWPQASCCGPEVNSPLAGEPAQREHSAGLVNHDYSDYTFINSDLNSNILTDYSAPCVPRSLTHCKCPPSNYQFPMTSCNTNSYNSQTHHDTLAHTLLHSHCYTHCYTHYYRLLHTDSALCNTSYRRTYYAIWPIGMGTTNRIAAVWLRRRPQRRRQSQYTV